MLDSVVKERLVKSFVSTEARILQQPLHLSSGYFKKFSKFPLQLQPLALPISRQREANSTALHAAVNTSFSPLSTEKIESLTRRKLTAQSTPPGFDELKRNRCRKPRNSLNIKEFSVSTAPEVGRIIDFQNLPSTPNLSFLSITCKNG
ncbi:hypothetical protein [Pseudomonas chlororaphis]|uniref:hypothetical protein n=1 Tax=Pseudomonas chlororaphis TaxID=587753 RepID=UPI0023658635|nr:hypothetical protein [Pseudomonas chlororaphis]WDH20994.1 hypothetical protein PUP50_23740 [Pseudomonas chlororaphis]